MSLVTGETLDAAARSLVLLSPTLANSAGGAPLAAQSADEMANTPLLGHALLQARGEADLRGLFLRHHSGAVHEQLRPLDSIAPLHAVLFDLFEQHRVEALGAAEYRGVGVNLRQRWRSSKLFSSPESLLASALWIVLLSVLSRHNFENATPATTHQDLEALISRQHLPATLINRLQPLCAQISERALMSHAALAEALSTQTEFANAVLLWLDQLHEEIAPSSSAQLQTATVADDLAVQQKPPDVPDVYAAHATDQDDDSAQQDERPDDLENVGDVSHELDSPADDEPNDSISLIDVFIGQFDEGVPEEVRNATQLAGRELVYAGMGVAATRYGVYTRRHDQVVMACELATVDEQNALRLRLDNHVERHARVVQQLASRLYHILQANPPSHWQYDLDEGILDSSKLPRLVSNPSSGLAFKQNHEQPYRDTAVTLLIDNSRSMLGKPIRRDVRPDPVD